jgi:putative ABC transport system permease protein
VGIYDGPPERDLRTVFFDWSYLDEGLKASNQEKRAGNAGCIVIRCRDSAVMPLVTERIDSTTKNSDTPTRTQTEEAFVKIFLEMYGDVRGLIRNVGIAVIFSLMCVAGNAMAMSLRERTTEVAVLRAMGFDQPLVVSLVLAEAVLVAGIGGLIGAFGSKLLFDSVDISQFMSQFVAFFYIPWPIALFGLGAALLIGFVSGIIPAIRAARLSVIDGLRKVV